MSSSASPLPASLLAGDGKNHGQRSNSSSPWPTRCRKLCPIWLWKPALPVVGTGRSDFPNQINNVLAFPGIFRGALDVRASDINEEMKIAAAHALADLVSPEELCPEYILPKAFDERVGPAVAKAVAEAARKSGVARI